MLRINLVEAASAASAMCAYARVSRNYSKQFAVRLFCCYVRDRLAWEPREKHQQKHLCKACLRSTELVAAKSTHVHGRRVDRICDILLQRMPSPSELFVRTQVTNCWNAPNSNTALVPWRCNRHLLKRKRNRHCSFSSRVHQQLLLQLDSLDIKNNSLRNFGKVRERDQTILPERVWSN